MDERRPQTLALWRYSVLGPLVSARLGHGDRKRLFREAAQRLYERPDGRRVGIPPIYRHSTIDYLSPVEFEQRYYKKLKAPQAA